MADNLKILKQNLDTAIDPTAGVGEILVQEHNDVFTELINKSGKYTGFPYKSFKESNNNIFSAGILSWNSNSFNDTNEFTITLSKLTKDLNDIGHILDLMNEQSIIHFKDYVGRSVILKYINHLQGVDGNNNIVYDVVVKGVIDNVNYTYQVNEVEDCVIDFLNTSTSLKVIIGTFEVPINNDIPFTLLDNDIIIWEGNTTPTITGTQIDVIFTDAITSQGIYKLKVEKLLDKIVITTTLLIKPIGERVDFTLNALATESPQGTFSFSGGSFTPRGYSNNSYVGDFEVQIDLDDSNSKSIMIGISTWGGNTDYNGGSSTNGYLLFMAVLGMGELRRNDSSLSFAEIDTPTTAQYNVGDKLSLKRTNDVVTMNFNGVEVHNYGTHIGDMYFHIAGSGTNALIKNLLKI